MKHISFQMLSLEWLLAEIDSNRYYNSNIQTTPVVSVAADTDYTDPENILNRLYDSFYLSGNVAHGCYLGIAFGVTQSVYQNIVSKSATEMDKNVYSSDYYNDGSIYLVGGQANYNDQADVVFAPLSKFSINAKSYLYNGAHIQLGDDSSLDKINSSSSDTCLVNYINKALSVVSQSDMESEKKAQLIKDLRLIEFSIEGLKPYNANFEGGLFGYYAVGQKQGFAMLQPSNDGIFKSEGFMHKVIDLLKSVNGSDGYSDLSNEIVNTEITSGPQHYNTFVPYVLLVSVGEEGVDDECVLESFHVGGTALQYQRQVTRQLQSNQAEIDLESLPNNRTRVKYTITAVPNGANNINFVANY